MKNVIFDFYKHGKLLSIEQCLQENFNTITINFCIPIRVLLLLAKAYYNIPICPYVFINTKLEQLFLNEISNTFLFRNRLEFISINQTLNTINLKYLNLNLYSESLTFTNLNPFVF